MEKISVKEKTFNISLGFETWRPNKKITFKKGKSFLNDIEGITQNVEDYIQKGDFIIIPKKYFNVTYTFEVVNVTCNNNGEPYCEVTSKVYVNKKVLNFLNNLETERLNNKENEHTTKITSKRNNITR